MYIYTVYIYTRYMHIYICYLYIYIYICYMNIYIYIYTLSDSCSQKFRRCVCVCVCVCVCLCVYLFGLAYQETEILQCKSKQTITEQQ